MARKRITKKQIKKIEKLVAAVVLLLATVYFVLFPPEDIQFTPAVNSYGEELNVHFIDVGQGDSIFIDSPDGRILIDAGLPHNSEQVTRYLADLGVEKLDLVVGTHPHSDHIGGLTAVFENFEVEKVAMPLMPYNLAPTSQTYIDLLEIIDSQNKIIESPQVGDVYTYGDLTLKFLWPDSTADSVNDYSFVIKLDYHGSTFLFTGDIERQSEYGVLNRGVFADVLKVAHHGSKTSSTKDFLEQVNPKIAVIQVGSGNSYGHPTAEVLERLTEVGAQVYRNDLNGTVVVSTNGSGEYRVTVQYGDGAEFSAVA